MQYAVLVELCRTCMDNGSRPVLASQVVNFQIEAGASAVFWAASNSTSAALLAGRRASETVLDGPREAQNLTV